MAEDRARVREDLAEINPNMAAYATAQGFRVIASVFDRLDGLSGIEAAALRECAAILEPTAGTA